MDLIQPLSRLRYSIPEAAAVLGVSRRTVYNRINEGKIAAVHDGSRVFITSAELHRYAGADQALQAS